MTQQQPTAAMQFGDAVKHTFTGTCTGAAVTFGIAAIGAPLLLAAAAGYLVPSWWRAAEKTDSVQKAALEPFTNPFGLRRLAQNVRQLLTSTAPKDTQAAVSPAPQKAMA